MSAEEARIKTSRSAPASSAVVTAGSTARGLGLDDAAILEATHEAILIADNATRRFRWVNQAACELLGYRREELLQRNITDIHPPDELEAIVEQFDAIAAGREPGARGIPCLRKDGTRILVDIRGSTVSIDGIDCNVGFFRDVTELRQLDSKDRKLAEAVAQTSDAVLVTGRDSRVEYVNPAFERLTGRPRDQLLGQRPADLFDPASVPWASGMGPRLRTGQSWSGDLVHRRPDGVERIAEASISPVRDADGGTIGYVAVERDVTDERAAAGERQRLATALEQTSDAMIVADADGTIRYVNRAFEAVSGYGRGDLLGRRMADLHHDHHDTAFRHTIRARIARNQVWSGTLTSRRKDGTPYDEEVTVSPIRETGGRVTGYLSVRRDVTAVRAAESALEREFRERAAVAAALAGLQPAATPEETAASICDVLLALTGIGAVLIVTFLDRRHAIPLAVRGPALLPQRVGRTLPGPRSSYLYDRALQGPWAEAWVARPIDGRYGRLVAASGIKAVAYAPLVSGDELLGVVAVATLEGSTVPALIQRFPVVGEFAAATAGLLVPQLQQSRSEVRIRRRVERALAPGGLVTIFEPIVDLATGRPVGYEALTRFRDGSRPDVLIAAAHAVDRGTELERACIEAALQAAAGLASNYWLSVNASPRVLIELDGLKTRLNAGREIVIELTEHAEVDDYPALRSAMDALGPGVALAVDDAGAGFASLRHVLELRPRFLKLDASLVKGVSTDIGRQAMIAGLRHYAERVGCRVIAEGIETELDCEMLREIGVPLGQGYLLSRPRGSAVG